MTNPFQVKVDAVDEVLQEELSELQESSAAKAKFESSSLSEFWIFCRPSFPALSTFCIHAADAALIHFPTTYLCELGFSAMLHIKSKPRNRLELSHNMRVCLSQTNADIKKLSRQFQAQSSHLCVLPYSKIYNTCTNILAFVTYT